MEQSFYARAKALVDQMTIEEKISQMSHDAPAIHRLGIPAYNWWNECLHGLARNGSATMFPQTIAMAATFDPEAIKTMGQVIATEVRARYNQMIKFGDTRQYEGLTMCCPNINIFRDPRWGRGQETYGEDPYLTGVMGASFVEGLQGTGEYRMVDTNLKHYAVHSGPEAERHGFCANVSRQELFRTYLWAFEYIIRHADPSAVMAAYSGVNGVPCTGNKELLKDILRDQFGFSGYVTSDAGGVNDLHEGHKVTENIVESAALAVNNGCDLNIGNAFKSLSKALEHGMVDEDTLTEAVVRLFEARYRLGMFDEDCPYNKIEYDEIESEKHRRINLDLAKKTIILLKNNGILPLKENLKVAVIGPNADCTIALKGNYYGDCSEYITPLRGIKAVSKGRVYYSRGADHKKMSDEQWWIDPLREAIVTARIADVVVLCVGLTTELEGEEGCGGDRIEIELPSTQRRLCDAILRTDKPVILVNISGSAVALTEYEERCAALLQCFYPGALGGEAIADVLWGRYNPAGRLPVTFYRATDDLPDFADYSMEGRTYRFPKKDPLYPFGFGLSYSNYEYAVKADQTVIPTNTDLKLIVNVKNLSPVGGDAVLQGYLETQNPNLTDPIRRLVYVKRAFIPAGETKAIDVIIPAELLREIDETGMSVPMRGTHILAFGGTQPDAYSVKLSGSKCVTVQFEIV